MCIMLKEVYINNIGGISKASLTFKGSFSVITGESGAGKSSLIRALELVAGKRAQATFIKSGKEEAQIEAIFSVDGIEDGELFSELTGEDEFLFVKRTLSANGRTRSYIQHRLTPLSYISTIMQKIMGIQSQFSQLELLDPQRQLELLDGAGGKDLLEIREKLNRIFTKAIKKEKELAQLIKKRDAINKKLDVVKEIIEDARLLDLTPESEKLWEDRLKEIQSTKKHLFKIQEALDKLTGGQADLGFIQEIACLFDGTKEGLVALTAIDEEALKKDEEAVLEGLERLEKSCIAAIRKYEIKELDEDLMRTEKNLGTLRKIKRATGCKTVEEVIKFIKEIDDNLKWLEDSKNTLQKLKIQNMENRKEISKIALELREARRKAALSLEEKVNQILRDLAMEDFRFVVSLEPTNKVKFNGADVVSFMLKKGDDLQGAVSKIASGGELSRLLLALQIAASDKMLPQVLVYDEVEAGLGGKAARLAGNKLKELSSKCQVILVTHEASIAALADQHFLVNRDGDNTIIKELTGEERVQELARMLAGDEDAPEAIEHARSLVMGTF